MTLFDDYGDEMPEEFQAFAAGVRAAATRMPEPSRALADLLITGVSSPQPKRSIFMRVRTYLAGLGVAAKVMLGAGMAAAATTGAAAAGVVPNPVSHVFNHNAEPAEHADDHVTNEPAHQPPTTVVHDDDRQDGDTPVAVVAEPTTTTTAVHHEEHHDAPSTTTTTMGEREDEPTTTTTTLSGTHDGDDNNPESIVLHCGAAREPDRIICYWTASTNPEHRRYALLQTNNINDEGRVAWQTENGLEYSDTYVTRTAQFTYRVVSLREDGTVESHSNAVTVACC
jgi:hypothetical protein